MLKFDPLQDNKSSITLINQLGSDQYICEIAKNSTSSTYDGLTKDEISKKVDGLISYLYRNKHTSPFEFVHYTFLITAPLFVVQQMLRHRTFKFNQASERFSILPNIYYFPEVGCIEGQSNKQLQCRDGNQVDENLALDYISDLTRLVELSNEFKNKYKGKIANEIVRLGSTTNLYTKIAICADLNNLLKFIRNRIADNAQFEIRKYAQCILECIKIYNPIVYNCFIKEINKS